MEQKPASTAEESSPAAPAEREKPFLRTEADLVNNKPFKLYGPQMIGGIVFVILVGVLIGASVFFKNYRIGIKNQQTVNHDSTKLFDPAEKKQVENRAVSQEEALKADKDQVAFAEKLNAIITSGTACGTAMSNADLQDINAEREELIGRAGETKRKIEELKGEFGKLSTADAHFTEPLTLIRDGLRLLTEAVRYYKQYYYSEDEDQEALRGSVMRKKAADANEKFRKAGAGVLGVFSGNTESISREEALKEDKDQVAFAEKLNAIITSGTACGTAMLNADLQDIDAEVEDLIGRAGETKRKIEELKGEFEKLSTADAHFTEPLTLIRDGLRLLTEAVRYYNQYYYSEDEDQEALRGSVMRKKAADANEKFRKAGASVLGE